MKEPELKEKPVPSPDDIFNLSDSDNNYIYRNIKFSDLQAAIGSSGGGLTQQQVEGLK